MTKLLPDTQQGIEQAARALQEGQLLAFPTETVFGLGALVSQPQAVTGIFEAKGRPADHPLIAHVSRHFDLTGWADVSSPQAQRLIEAFWPGPLTLVVPKGEKMPTVVTGGQSSVGVRCPSHPIAQALLSLLDAPVAAPSANRFGKVSPTHCDHVLQELNGRIGFILQGSQSELGIESTIVSLLDSQPVLLRPGSITVAQLEAALGMPVLTQSHGAG
ncbi:MAG: L-threonylcarbamoyladenylate synthase, partial [Limnobacter sp.]|nr:L-threonylcarbamoyladenylate synthase [Limnobacter sp.]